MLFQSKEKKSSIVVLDIGATKIICLVASIVGDKNFEIMACGHAKSLGFKNGVVTNKKLFETAIITAVEMAEKKTGITIDQVILTFASSFFVTNTTKNMIKLSPMRIISHDDINYIHQKAISSVDSEQYEIISSSIERFILDNSSLIDNPIGLVGTKLTAVTNIVKLPTNIVQNIVNCLIGCQIRVEDIIFTPQALMYSCLSYDEIINGSVIVDIGGSTTSYAIISNNKIIDCGAIALGGINITNDIAKILSINYKDAERLKVLSGSTITSFADNYKTIEISIFNKIDNSDEIFTVSNAKLNNIIAARVEEIFELVHAKIKQFTHSNLIVLTGGSSVLNGIRETASNVFGGKIKLVNHHTALNFIADIDFSITTASIGAIKYYSDLTKKRTAQNKNNQLSIKSLKKWLAENF